MTFYERARGTKELKEIKVGTAVNLKDSVVRRKKVSRVATVVGPDTLQIAHHLVQAPGIQPGGWPSIQTYEGEKVNSIRLWMANPDGGENPDKRIIWEPTPQS